MYNHLKERERGSMKSTPRASKLDPYEECLRSRLERFELPETVLLQRSARATVADWIDCSVRILAKTKELPCTEITAQVLDQARRKAG